MNFTFGVYAKQAKKRQITQFFRVNGSNSRIIYIKGTHRSMRPL